ncbi:hypothetical protein Q4577_09885 [Marinovum sp. 2_MG-2023]|uniref:hypothetical protein n=1 Tax=unclassified Marinovum TaxID=2647166 RepID=UPI0026E260E7|nr:MULTISPECIES: hypothetical protein [unclassified Marinovum]MDO6730330.1 hypothetical protein [Marinovum sp. 2_MG-2023]MDO6779068.1 hypothetical protein [Marinovum sp. 1_MG-2023]
MFKSLFSVTVVACMALGIANSTLAQSPRTETVKFERGASEATINDQITGREIAVYEVAARQGQRLKVQLEPSNLETYFNVYVPGKGPGMEAWANAQFTSIVVPEVNCFDSILPDSGAYSIMVFMMRSAARRGEVSDFKVHFSIE